VSFDKHKLEGMTVNERLFETKQLAAFDAAVAARDLKQLRGILESIYVDEPSIQSMLKNAENWDRPPDDPIWRHRL